MPHPFLCRGVVPGLPPPSAVGPGPRAPWWVRRPEACGPMTDAIMIGPLAAFDDPVCPHLRRGAH